MNVFRRHPYLITLAAMLVILPVPVFAVGEDLVYGLVTSVFGMFVRLAAILLNFAINSFVIDFGGVYANSGVGYAVDTTWIIIRDFVNMFFIFGFVYIGFKMILNSNDSNTRRWLVNLLLAALLVNFSLFVTKFVVDFSNQLAAQIVVGGMSSEGYEVNANNVVQVDLGQSFLDRMGITSVWSNRPENAQWGYIFGTAILFMITAFVFAAGGILLIIRFAVLNLFLVLSPVMFLSWILPGLKDTMNRYWSMFLGRAFFAPIYLLFIYFSLQIISGLQVAVNSGPAQNLANPNWASTFQAVGDSGISDVNSSTAGTLPFFVLICIFMILSLVVAQKMGADGGSRAVALGKNLGNKVQRGVTNTARNGGRFAARSAGGVAARGVGGAAENARQRYLLRDAQNPIDTSTRAGKIRQAARDGRQQVLGRAENASVLGSETVDQRRTRLQNNNDTRNKEHSRALDEDRRRQDIAGAAITRNEGESDADFATRQTEAATKRDKAVQGMSNDQLLAFARENKAQITSPEFAAALSDAQMKALKDSGIFTDTEAKTLKTNRDNGTFKDLEDTLNGTGREFQSVEEETKALEDAFESLGKTIKSMSDDRLTGLGADRLKDKRFAANLSDKQIETLQSSGKYTLSDIDSIKKARNEGIQNSAGVGEGVNEFFKGRQAGAGTAVANKRAEKMLQGNVQDAGKLPPQLFTDPNLAKHITPQALEQRIRNGVTNAEAAAIKQSLDMHINGLSYSDPSRKAWESWENKSVNAARINLNIRQERE